MDNLSHALAGLAAGELIHRLLPAEDRAERQSGRHRLLLTTAALACNFPDLDLVLTPLLPEPLGYLLHHRGHTHTLAYALPQMLLLTLAMLAWPGVRRLLGASGTVRAGFVLALVFGFGLHLAMDYLNSYGLHPFHPFDSGWLYGDMVFILEPMFWIALGVPLAMTIASRRWRLFWTLLLLAIPLYFTVNGYLSWAALFGLYGVAAAAALMQRRGGQGHRGVVAGIAMLAVFLGIQAVASQQAGLAVRQAIGLKPDAGTVHDVALTAFPSHPFCWVFAAIESDEERDAYRLTRGVVSLLPGRLPAAACPRSLNPAGAQGGEAALVVIDEAIGSLSTLRETRARNCFFDAWMRFARMPMLEGDSAADLRFQSSIRGNFTTIDLSAFERALCPADIPQWRHPRADMLRLPAVLHQGAPQ